MYTIPLQALSQNMAWVGKRYKSKLYKQYESDIFIYLHTFQLPKLENKQKFYLYFQFGVPNNQDVSNGIKILEDVITRFLGVDDRDVLSLYASKIVTTRAKAFINFDIFTDKSDFLQTIIEEVSDARS